MISTFFWLQNGMTQIFVLNESAQVLSTQRLPRFNSQVCFINKGGFLASIVLLAHFGDVQSVWSPTDCHLRRHAVSRVGCARESSCRLVERVRANATGTRVCNRWRRHDHEQPGKLTKKRELLLGTAFNPAQPSALFLYTSAWFMPVDLSRPLPGAVADFRAAEPDGARQHFWSINHL